MSASANLNLKLDFNQILDLVKQLPKKQQQQLADILGEEEPKVQNLSNKEQKFLNELDEAVNFVNNYPKEKINTKSFKQMLDAL